jgi:glycosyltransferase involved in cell wall biosynthesis
MKIGMLSNSLQGGIWNHSIGLSLALGRQGHPVEMFSRNPPGNGIPHHRVPALPLSFYEFFYRKSGLLSGLRESDPDIVHTHHQLGNLDFYLPKLKRLRRPLVSTIHITPSNSSRIDRTVSLYFRRTLSSLRSADRLICVSGYMKGELEGLGLEGVSVIPNGVDTQRFYPEPLRTGRGHGAFRLLFVGRLSPEKGVAKLLAACSAIPGATLDIVGSGPLSHLCRLYAAKRRNIRFLGRVSNDALRKLYSSADLTVFPSTWQEPFGLVLLESMACGTPVLAFGVGGVPEIVVEGRNGSLVREKTAAGLREAILYARENPFPSGTPGFCVRYVKERFSWDRAAAGTIRVYREAMGC